MKYIIDKETSKKIKLAINLKTTKKSQSNTKSISHGIITLTAIFGMSLFFNQPNNENTTMPIQNDTYINNNISYNNEPICEKNYKEALKDYEISIDGNHRILFDVNCHKDIHYIEKFMQTNEYKYFEKYSIIYGVDPQIMVAIALQESSLNHDACLPTGSNYNGCATGIMQIENLGQREVTAYNYEEQCFETVQYNNNTVLDYETNVKVGCMMFQSAIQKFNGNIYMAIQSHNYGEEMIDKILNNASKDFDISVEDLKNNYNDLRWTKYLSDVHNNPLKYNKNWEYKTYGDEYYLKKILSSCIEEDSNYKFDNEDITFNLRYGYKKDRETRKK